MQRAALVQVREAAADLASPRMSLVFKRTLAAEQSAARSERSEWGVGSPWGLMGHPLLAGRKGEGDA